MRERQKKQDDLNHSGSLVPLRLVLSMSVCLKGGTFNLPLHYGEENFSQRSFLNKRGYLQRVSSVEPLAPTIHLPDCDAPRAINYLLMEGYSTLSQVTMSLVASSSILVAPLPRNSCSTIVHSKSGAQKIIRHVDLQDLGSEAFVDHGQMVVD